MNAANQKKKTKTRKTREKQGPRQRTSKKKGLQGQGPQQQQVQGPLLDERQPQAAFVVTTADVGRLPYLCPRPGLYDLAALMLLARVSSKLHAADGPGDDDACWEWAGGLNRDGYGYFSPAECRNELAHRAVYRLCVGDLPPRMEVCHRCDNPACLRPAHLRLGTHRDNMRDAARKGRLRNRDCGGERNPSARLTRKQVESIRARHAEGGVSAAALAREHRVSASAVRQLLKGQTW